MAVDFRAAFAQILTKLELLLTAIENSKRTPYCFRDTLNIDFTGPVQQTIMLPMEPAPDIYYGVFVTLLSPPHNPDVINVIHVPGQNEVDQFGVTAEDENGVPVDCSAANQDVMFNLVFYPIP